MKGSGNRITVTLDPRQGLTFGSDQNQVGSQPGIRNAALAWTLMWELLQAAGWTAGAPRSLHRGRVILLNGQKFSDKRLTCNPAFTDWMMGWPPGWTDPQQPVTGWCHWLRRGRGAC